MKRRTVGGVGDKLMFIWALTMFLLGLAFATNYLNVRAMISSSVPFSQTADR
jgi:hypothetical protein